MQAEKYTTILINYCKGNSVNGFEIAKTIKKTNKLINIPIILIISAFDKSRFSFEDLKIFSAVITNPIKESGLINAILNSNDIEYKKGSRFTSIQSQEGIKKIKNISEAPKAISYKILLCEDNPINIKVVMATLNKMGHKIDVATNGQEGIDKIFDGSNQKKYDIILMDCMMPVMDGFMASKYIRKEEKIQKMPHTPIIALTANISEDDKDKCYEYGMDYFLSKPIKKELIVEAMEKCLKLKKCKHVVAKD